MQTYDNQKPKVKFFFKKYFFRLRLKKNIFLGRSRPRTPRHTGGSPRHTHTHTRARQFATKKIPMQLDKQKGLSYHNARVCVVSLGSLSK